MSPAATGAAEELSAFLAGARSGVEAALDRHLPPAGESRLAAAMRHAVFAGGKRIRPALALLAGESFGVLRETLLPAAAALEMVHTFSLVHDDLPALDDDDLRRGRPTVHRAFDEATAVLAGDALLTCGLGLVARAPREATGEQRAAVTALLADAVEEMIGGQMDDLAAEAEWPADPEAALERIHRRKTGALITAALLAGSAYAWVDGTRRSLLAELGERLGLLFQIADDILDVEGTAASLGKTAGKDAAAEKLTFVALHGLAASRKRLDEVAAEARELAGGLPGTQRWRALVDYLVRRDR